MVQNDDPKRHASRALVSRYESLDKGFRRGGGAKIEK